MYLQKYMYSTDSKNYDKYYLKYTISQIDGSYCESQTFLETPRKLRFCRENHQHIGEYSQKKNRTRYAGKYAKETGTYLPRAKSKTE